MSGGDPMSALFTFLQMLACIPAVLLVRLRLMPTSIMILFLRSGSAMVRGEALHCIAATGSRSIGVATEVLECALSDDSETEDDAIRAISTMGLTFAKSLSEMQTALSRLSRRSGKEKVIHALISSIPSFGSKAMRLVPVLLDLAANQSKPIAREIRSAAGTLISQSELFYFLTNDFLARLLVDVAQALVRDSREWGYHWERGLERVAGHLHYQSEHGRFKTEELNRVRDELGLLVFQNPTNRLSTLLGRVIQVLQHGEDDDEYAPQLIE